VKIRDRITDFRRVRASELRPNPRNWRTHPEAQQDALRGVLSEIGYADALIARELPSGDLELLDGHLRAETTPDAEVPVLIVDLDDAEAAKLLACLDPMAAMAEADADKLAELMADLSTESEGLQAMLDDLADREGISILEETSEEPPEAQTDRAAELQEEWKVERGQLWEIGKHRLLCGDSTSEADVGRVMGGERAELLHADPPYGMGKEKDGIANDNLYREKLDAFQMSWWNAARASVADNGSAYIWGTAEDLWRLWYCGGLKESERLTFRNEIVWAKGSAGAGGISHQGADGLRLYPQETERCLFFMLGEQGFNNNADNYWDGWEPIRSQLAADCEAMGWVAEDVKRICGVGMYCHWFTRSQWAFIPEEHYKKLQAAARDHDAFKRDYDDLKREFYATRAYFDNTHDNMTDVWTFPRVTGSERHDHATPKPVAMIERIIKTSTDGDGTILDPFLGSGTTMVAAEQLKRICYGIEIEPKYCSVILQRMTDMGLEPRLSDG
jgi:DNA modification methylase